MADQTKTYPVSNPAFDLAAQNLENLAQRTMPQTHPTIQPLAPSYNMDFVETSTLQSPAPSYINTAPAYSLSDINPGLAQDYTSEVGTNADYYNSNPAQGFDPNMSNPNMPMDNMYNQPQDYQQYQTPQTNYQFDQNTDPNVDYSNPNLDYNTQNPNNFDPNQQYLDDDTTPDQMHEEPRSGGNKNLMIYGLVGLMALLTVVSVGLYFYTQNVGASKTVTTATSSVVAITNPKSASTNVRNIPIETPSSDLTTGPSSSKPVQKGTSITGGQNTPATKAKKLSLTQNTSEWIKKNFLVEDLNEDGSCKTITVCGPKADPDADGLTNIDEENYATDPNNADSDGDGISDGNELFVYYTDPNKTDSDNDTYFDGDEITNCYDPVQASTEKLSQATQNRITAAARSFSTLSKVTVEKLKKAGATSTDIEKGYLVVKCGNKNTITNATVTTSAKPL